jgi:predicted alpha/beta superfamily hydrolase
VAGSPSIWWDNLALLKEEEQFLNRLAAETVQTRLLIGVGELERNHQSRIVENAQEMARRLAGLESRGLRVIFKQFGEEGHISVLPVLLSRVLNFAMQPAQ